MADRKPYQSHQSNLQGRSFFLINNGDDKVAISYASLSNIHLLAIPNRENVQLLGFHCDKDIVVFAGNSLHQLQTDLMEWKVSSITRFDEEMHATPDPSSPVIRDIQIKSKFSELRNIV